MTALGLEYRSMRQEIDHAIARVLASGRYALDDELERFETEFARYIGTAYAVGVGSGTDALTIALRALDLDEDAEVITAPNTDSPTASAVIHAGARVAFADVDARTFTLDPEQVERMVNQKTKVLLPVHLFGMPANMSALGEIAARHELIVVEDSALAVGARFEGRRTGSFGRIGCFSLAPSKILGGYGDGGVIATDDEVIAERARVLRNYGHAPGLSLDPSSLLGGGAWSVIEHGQNSRLDSLQAAVLRVKLVDLDERIAARRRVAYSYNELLSETSVTTPLIPPNVEPTFFAYNVLVEERDQLRDHLARRGVASRLYYNPPLHLQRAFDSLGYSLGSFPVAEETAGRMLALPIFPQLTADQIEWVADAVAQGLRMARTQEEAMD
jgi:dTDP-4-amino-4,6-dideoxygalactose transaminase